MDGRSVSFAARPSGTDFFFLFSLILHFILYDFHTALTLFTFGYWFINQWPLLRCLLPERVVLRHPTALMGEEVKRHLNSPINLIKGLGVKFLVYIY